MTELLKLFLEELDAEAKESRQLEVNYNHFKSDTTDEEQFDYFNSQEEFIKGHCAGLEWTRRKIEKILKNCERN